MIKNINYETFLSIMSYSSSHNVIEYNSIFMIMTDYDQFSTSTLILSSIMKKY